MEQISEKSQHISADDIRNNPELIAQILLENHDISVFFEKRGNEINYVYLKTYEKESIRILQEAKNEYLRKEGYTHEQAFKDFEKARKEINKHL